LTDNADRIVASELRRLDDVLGPDFQVSLGQNRRRGARTQRSNGMRRIVANSSEIKILFEKLSTNLGTEQALEEYFDEGVSIFTRWVPDSSLDEIEAGGLKERSGYMLATRHGAIAESTRGRSRFFGVSRTAPDALTTSRGSQNFPQASRVGENSFHGPYWFYEKVYGGSSSTARSAERFHLACKERFGYHVLGFPMSAGQSEHVFILQRDLHSFRMRRHERQPKVARSSSTG